MEKAIPLQGEGARDKSYHLQSQFFEEKPFYSYYRLQV